MVQSNLAANSKMVGVNSVTFGMLRFVASAMWSRRQEYF
jgi:hypothetical protein